jgi:prepilin-type N-terminal cleavage/methylation domain-containing protein
MRNLKGFTLLEILIVIALIGTLSGIAILAYSQWQRKYNVEAQVKEMLSDLTNARLMAIQTKREHRVFLNPMAYTTVRYEDENDQPRVDASDGGNIVDSHGIIIGNRQYAKTLKYTIQQLNTTNGSVNALSNTPLIFNDRGYSTTRITIVFDWGRNEGALNCLVVHDARINIGRINNANTCVLQ